MSSIIRAAAALLAAAAAGAALVEPARAQDSTLSASFSRALAGVAELRAGRFAAAASALDSAAVRLDFHPGVAYFAALAQAGAGNGARALHWLNRVAAFGVSFPLDTVRALDSLRARADYAAVRARIAENERPLVSSVVAFTVAERDLMPESVAHDPTTGAFYVGSIYRRKIVRFHRDGRVEDWVPEARDGLWGVLGMKVDADRRVLWVNACNLGRAMPMAAPDTTSVGRTGVFRYDLATGQLVRRYLAGGGADTICFNDLAITRAGDVYISSGPRGIWRIAAAADTLERFTESRDLIVNGIALSADDSRLYLADARLGVVVMDLSARRHRPVALPAGATLNGVDGLYVHRGALVAIQNGLQPNRVVHAALAPAGDRVTAFRVLESNHPLYDIPTTGVIVGDSLVYVATSQLRRLDASGRMLPRDQLRDNVVLRLGLDAEPSRPRGAGRDTDRPRAFTRVAGGDPRP